jgi:hypothetical protein
MNPLYFGVNKGAESLTAILAENTPQDIAHLKRKTGAEFVPSRRVELCYSDYKTMSRTYVTLLGGLSACVYWEKIDFLPSKDKKQVPGAVMPGHFTGFAKLGPELKKQIPQDWYEDIGEWLDEQAQMEMHEESLATLAVKAE